MFKKKHIVISRGEGKNTVAIALSQADPLVEIAFVSLSCTLHGIRHPIYRKIDRTRQPLIPLLYGSLL